jgi:hypothetical protein
VIVNDSFPKQHRLVRLGILGSLSNHFDCSGQLVDIEVGDGELEETNPVSIALLGSVDIL